MAKRIITKIGDVFSVPINETQKRYMQLVAFDMTQLNSDVIRAFKRIYFKDETPELDEIINDEIFFYSHCVTKFRIKLSLWEQVGNIQEVGNIENVLFRGSRDVGKVIDGQLVALSNNWYIWRINDKDFTDVGKLEGDHRNADLGTVVNPYDIVDRIKTGKYNFVYPDFE